jgi:NAD(P)-dependent dehydrogenase (short-subunit alcohol dehydrogenase family)
MNTILITGANRGIGLELVKQYYRSGWKVLACCRSSDKAFELQGLVDKSNGKIIIYCLDITNEKNIVDLSVFLEKQPIDILLNNAGIFGPVGTNMDTIKSEDWLYTFKVNTIAPFLVARAFINHVSNSQHKIIANMSSNMGSIFLNDRGGEYIYRSSKAALNSITKSLSNDLAEKNVIVIALHPGWVRTGMGGPNGEIDVITSARGLCKVLSSVSLKDSGTFIGYNGENLAW